jgi:hypothetical protein
METHVTVRPVITPLIVGNINPNDEVKKVVTVRNQRWLI